MNTLLPQQESMLSEPITDIEKLSNLENNRRVWRLPFRGLILIKVNAICWLMIFANCADQFIESLFSQKIHGSQDII